MCTLAPRAFPAPHFVLFLGQRKRAPAQQRSPASAPHGGRSGGQTGAARGPVHDGGAAPAGGGRSARRGGSAGRVEGAVEEEEQEEEEEQPWCAGSVGVAAAVRQAVAAVGGTLLEVHVGTEVRSRGPWRRRWGGRRCGREPACLVASDQARTV